MASLLIVLLLLGPMASPARAAMAAWWNGIGPQIILQDMTTGQIRHSACNSDEQPRYSHSGDYVLPLTRKPKLGTPLAGTGWLMNVMTQASIFYVDQGGNIINALFNCNVSTGLFYGQGNWIISDQAPSIHSNTGLAAVVLGAEAGYRVYYHDEDGAVNELKYTPADDWHYEGVISNDINSLPALAATFTGRENISIASPRDDENIAVTRWTREETWYRSTLPRPLVGNFTTSEADRDDIAINETAPANFALPAWDGKAKGLGISVDRRLTRFLWYIGNDSNLYSVANVNSSWSLQPSQSTAFWPQADTPNAELAVAHNFRSSTVRIYYMVDGQLSEIKFENNTWMEWSTVPEPEPRATQPSEPAPSNPPGEAGTGLSTGAKAGIGVGVSLGAIAIGAIVAVIILAWRKKRRLKHARESEDASTARSPDTSAPSSGNPAAKEGPGWESKDRATPADADLPLLDSVTRPSELDVSQPMHELPVQPYTYELSTDPPRRFQEQGR